MPRLKKTGLLFCLSLFLLLYSPQFTFSQEDSAPKKDFSANFDVDYQVLENSNTRVTQKISLTNLTPNFYAKEYNLSIGSTKIEKVTASDSLGKIDAQVTKNEKSTSINLTFNDRVVGEGKSLTFNLNYEISDVASKNGLMWEITIPKLAISADIKDYNLDLMVPSSFGEIHYLSPDPVEVKEGTVRTYRFNREQLEKSGVSSAFGKYQLFDFELKYHLFNPNLFSAAAQISLPPDTSSQKVIYDTIDPKPQKLEVDPDGNYLATYELKSRQRIDIVAKGSIQMVEAHRDLQTLSEQNEDDLDQYLKGNRHWNIDGAVKEKAEELTTGLAEAPTETRAKALYDFVSTNLSYSYDRLKTGEIERLGALGALNNPDQAICMEYTDLFISLARSIGIPAREVNGYAYTQNKDLRPTAIGGQITSDILHAWPEYYDTEKKRWVQIDPTWGSTTGGVDYFDKLDTNHITFVRKGLSSEEPVPAGAYKLDQDSSGDVKITPSTNLRDEKPVLEVRLKDSSYPSGLNNNAPLIIKNTGKRPLFNAQIRLDEETQKYVGFENSILAPILPGAEGEVNFKIKTPNFLSSADFVLKGQLVGSDGSTEIIHDFSEQVSLKPFFTLGMLPYFFGVLIAIIVSASYFLFRHEFRSPKPKSVLPK